MFNSKRAEGLPSCTCSLFDSGGAREARKLDHGAGRTHGTPGRHVGPQGGEGRASNISVIAEDEY